MGFILNLEEKNILEAINETYMIGTLISENDNFYRKSIETRQNPQGDSVNFYIKPLCEESKVFTTNKDLATQKYFMGQDNHTNTKALGMTINYQYLPIEDKIELIKNKLEGKLVIFKPRIKIKKDIHSQSNDSYNIYKNIEIIAVEELKDKDFNDIYFEKIPLLNYSCETFENKLNSEDYITFNEFTPDLEGPEYIICDDFLYLNFKLGCWQSEKRDKVVKKLMKDEKNNYQKIKINLSDKEFMSISKNIRFVSSEFLMDFLDQNEETIEDKDCQEICESKVENEANNFENPKEIEFLKSFETHTMDEGLLYDPIDLYNFHICLKTNLLTILTGMTGTGKSKLTRAYSHILDVSEENRTLLFLPVSPSFTEPSDLIGYLNPSTGIYIPSETGLTDLLVNASKNPDKIHLVVFDEMNLSQIEYWFAPFISLLEEKEENRYLKLYGEHVKCINDILYPSKIKIGKNIRFVGTMNLDETTRDISDRLLDRANTITLLKKSFVDLKDFNEDKMYENDYAKKSIKYQCPSYEDYESWINSESPYKRLKRSELEFFDDLHDKIIKFDYQKGVSFRVLERIGIYLNNIPIDINGTPKINFSDAIDLQVAQRIISKLKGSSKQFGPLIGTYDFDTEDVANSELLTLFNAEVAKSISPFERVKSALILKSKELTSYGYTN